MRYLHQAQHYRCSQYGHSRSTFPAELSFFGWVCCANKLTLTSYIVIVFYSEPPSLCVIHLFISFIHDFILFLVILTLPLAHAAGATCKNIEFRDVPILIWYRYWNRYLQYQYWHLSMLDFDTDV